MIPGYNARAPQQEDVGQLGYVQNIGPVCDRCSRVVTQATLDRDNRIDTLFLCIFAAGEAFTTSSLIWQGIQYGGALGGVLGATVGALTVSLELN